MDHYKVIGDIDELKNWWKFGVTPLKPEEVYFLSVSFRNKVLSESERAYYGLGRSEMCEKEIIAHDDFSRVIQALRKLEFPIEGSLSKIGIPKPQKARRIYWNLTPINAYSASCNITSLITETQHNLLNVSLKNNNIPFDHDAWHKIRKIHDKSLSMYARCFGTKTWVDIDVDFNKGYENTGFEEALDKVNSLVGVGNCLLVKTEGGYHFLIRRSILKFNPMYIENNLRMCYNGGLYSEITQNKNQMIPMPGTFSGENFVVRVMNWKDFDNVEPFHKEIV